MVRLKRKYVWSAVVWAVFGLAATAFFLLDLAFSSQPVPMATFAFQLTLSGAILAFGVFGSIVMVRHRIACAPGRLTITELRTTAIRLETVETIEWSNQRGSSLTCIRAEGRARTIGLDSYAEEDTARIIEHLRQGIAISVQRHWLTFVDRRVRPQTVATMRREREMLQRLSLRVMRLCIAGAVAVIALGLVLSGGQIAAPFPVACAKAVLLLGIGVWVRCTAIALRRQQLRRARIRRDLWRTLAAHGVAEPTATEHQVDSSDPQGVTHGT